MTDGLNDAFFRALFHSRLSGIAVADIPTETIIEINDVLLDILGCRRDQIVGIQRAWEDFTPPEFRYLDEQGMRQVVEVGYSDPFEKEYLRPDGSRIPVRVSSAVVAGYPDRLIVYVTDISREAAARAREQFIQRRFEIAISAADQGVWDYDLVTGEMTYSDRAKEIYGLPADQQVTFELIRDATHPDDLPITHAQFLRAIDPEVRDRNSYEYRIVRPDATICWALAFGEAVFEGTGADAKAVRYVGTLQDVTARKYAERRQQALLRLDEEMRDVAETANLSFVAAKTLGEALGADRCGYGVIDAASRTITVERNWGPGLADVAGHHHFDDYGTYVHELVAGKYVANSDAAADPRTSANADAFEALGIRAHLDVPVVEDGRAVAEMFVHSRRPRVWSPDEIEFVREFAERTHSAIARRSAEEARRVTEARFRAIFDSDLIGLAIFDALTGATETINDRFLTMTGHTRSDFDDCRWDWRDFTIPEYLPLDEAAIAQARKRGWWDPYEKDYRALNGRRFPVRISSAALPGFPGKVVVSVEDVSERKRWEDHQRLLIGELNHRVKNSLAIVQSLARQTFPSEPAFRSYVEAYDRRLAGLAATHNLLTRANWAAADVDALVHDTLAVHGMASERFVIKGDQVAFAPQPAVSLGMALHELATNALKYGSLSTADGHVDVQWYLADDAFNFVWQEVGGPPVRQPDHRGFGTRMIERALSSALNGSAELNFLPDGLRCSITAPLANVLSAENV